MTRRGGFNTTETRSIFKVVIVRTGTRRRGAALQELRRVALFARLAAFAGLARFARAAFARVSADLRLQFNDVEEHIGLAPQFVGDHRGLGRDC